MARSNYDIVVGVIEGRIYDFLSSLANTIDALNDAFEYVDDVVDEATIAKIERFIHEAENAHKRMLATFRDLHRYVIAGDYDDAYDAVASLQDDVQTIMLDVEDVFDTLYKSDESITLDYGHLEDAAAILEDELDAFGDVLKAEIDEHY